jgi:hypothetical protein
MEPGSSQSVQITTSDLEAVRKELVERGSRLARSRLSTRKLGKFVPLQGPPNVYNAFIFSTILTGTAGAKGGVTSKGAEILSSGASRLQRMALQGESRRSEAPP